MQLTLWFLEPPDQPSKISTPKRASTAWDGIDEASRLTALAILTRLIVQMLAADLENGASDD
jgi:hypothetical protein